MDRQPLIQVIRIAVSAACALLISSSNARAQGVLIAPLPGTQPAPDGSDPPARAWNEGVTANQREQAAALFQEAGKFVEEFLFEEAVAKYREALSLWNHPAIHGNMSRALIALGRPLEAYHAIQEALRHGPEPLGDDPDARERNQESLRDLEKLARKQLVEVTVKSAVPGVKIFVAEQRVKTDDKAGSVLVLPRLHRMSAQKSGHQTLVHSLDASAGRDVEVEIASGRRMRPWKPWTVLATGVGLSAFGGALVWNARNRLDSLEQTLAEECPPPLGCLDAEPYESDWKKTRWRQRIGIGSLIVGGSALITGVALVWWNQRRRFTVRTTVDRTVSLEPMVSPTVAGLNGTLSF